MRSITNTPQIQIPTHLSFESLPLLRNDDKEKKDRGAVQQPTT